MNSVLKEDLELIINSELIDWKKIDGKSLFITGGTGLIGSIFIKAILLRNELFGSNIKLILIVRDEEEAIKIFGTNKNIVYIVSNVESYAARNIKIDYIIHAASPTKSKYFIEKPIETLDTAILGTRNILEQARISNVASMIYLSSMEMYGIIDSSNVSEEKLGYINPLDVRSSYSEGKRICELYNLSYYNEYNIPTKIARIAQTFGPGISKNENRVYKIFADSILNKQDIILKSTGSTIINYSYTTDTIIGLLYILLNGKSGEAYNLVGEDTNMTILDSAKWLADTFGENRVGVKIEIPKEGQGFAPDNKMVISNEKLVSLGWKPKFSLKDGYTRLLKYLIEENNK